MKELSIGTESAVRARIVLTSLLAAIKNELETKKATKRRRGTRKGERGVEKRGGPVCLKSRALCSHAVSSSYRYPVTFCGGLRVAQIFE